MACKTLRGAKLAQRRGVARCSAAWTRPRLEPRDDADQSRGKSQATAHGNSLCEVAKPMRQDQSKQYFKMCEYPSCSGRHTTKEYVIPNHICRAAEERQRRAKIDDATPREDGPMLHRTVTVTIDAGQSRQMCQATAHGTGLCEAAISMRRD